MMGGLSYWMKRMGIGTAVYGIQTRHIKHTSHMAINTAVMGVTMARHTHHINRLKRHLSNYSQKQRHPLNSEHYGRVARSFPTKLRGNAHGVHHGVQLQRKRAVITPFTYVKRVSHTTRDSTHPIVKQLKPPIKRGFFLSPMLCPMPSDLWAYTHTHPPTHNTDTPHTTVKFRHTLHTHT